jgi:hypothetical protein
MRKRSGKYLNAREYAERLFLADNYDIQDFARDFLEALDAFEDEETDAIKEAIEAIDDIPADKKTNVQKVEWLADEASTLAEVEEAIVNACPEYQAQIENGDILDVIAGMVARLRPVQEYDL